jgi:hypothetical protein
MCCLLKTKFYYCIGGANVTKMIIRVFLSPDNQTIFSGCSSKKMFLCLPTARIRISNVTKALVYSAVALTSKKPFPVVQLNLTNGGGQISLRGGTLARQRQVVLGVVLGAP